MHTEADPLVVIKLGGSSVSSAERWATIESVLRQTLVAGENPVVVHSALSGVTDLLQRLAIEPRTGKRTELLAELDRRHDELMVALDVDDPDLLGPDRTEFREILDGLDEPARDSRAASILAFGERMATRIGAAWLVSQGLPVTWVDARELLESVDSGRSGSAVWLSAECDSEFDFALSERVRALGGVVMTQGFTARNTDGRTVVLGRGGSDTAAAYLSGKLGAVRLEIWSDVPGMFSADPRATPGARLLKRLGYAEAQEIATTGSKVLHPRCIPALRHRGIPIHLKSTLDPELPGTVISVAQVEDTARVKAVSFKTGVVLVSMETVGMWQQVGFLSRIAQVFSEAELSLDLVSTSETNITVSLDSEPNLLDERVLARVLDRLSEFCDARLIRPCASVSLVGQRIRSLLHQLGPAFEAFQEHRIYLVSQAASDLNLTVVVDESQAARLVRQLHSQLVAKDGEDSVIGPSWQELQGDGPSTRPAQWWEAKHAELLAIGSEHSSAYVYDLETVRARLDSLQSIEPVARILYSMKANSHPAILAEVEAAGAGFECVSPGEVSRVLGLFPDLDPKRILFTPNFAPRDEYVFGLEAGVNVALDALHPLVAWPELFRDREVVIRVDLGWGSGHHEKVVTGGTHSKFGIPLFEMDELVTRVEALGAHVVAIHSHSGSGIRSADHWPRVAELLLELVGRFPSVGALNLGGGLGVPEKPGDQALDLRQMEEGLKQVQARHPDLELWLEPGRYLVAEAGVLVAQVTQTKGKSGVRYIGVATGMNSLIRPALYGAYHQIVNLTRLGEPSAGLANVVGPICESGDRLGIDRPLPDTREGDVLLIATAGAYGYAMSSRFNLREPATEVVVGRDAS